MSVGAAEQLVLQWSQRHAVVMLIALAAIAAGLSVHWLIAAVWLSLLRYLFQVRSVWSGSRFYIGAANSITLFRLFVLCLILVVYPLPSALVCGWILIALLCLDGVDGYVARRFSESSVAGQYLDVEVDAFAIAAMSIMLWQHLDHFSMIIVAGALRYLYVLTIRFFISESRTEPKRQYASFIAVLVYIAMVLELAFHNALTYSLLMLGMLLLTGSFLRSFIYQWRGI